MNRRPELLRGVARGAFAVAGVALAFALAGCAVRTGTTPPPPVKATVGVPRPVSPAATPTFGSGTSLHVPCNTLLPPASVIALDPALVADNPVRAAEGSDAAEALAIQGTACSWSAPEGTTLVVSVAQPDAATLDTLKAAASSGDPSSSFGAGVSAFTHGNELQLFTANGLWVTADSPLFSNSSKQTPIGQALLAALGGG